MGWRWLFLIYHDFIDWSVVHLWILTKIYIIYTHSLLGILRLIPLCERYRKTGNAMWFIRLKTMYDIGHSCQPCGIFNELLRLLRSIQFSFISSRLKIIWQNEIRRPMKIYGICHNETVCATLGNYFNIFRKCFVTQGKTDIKVIKIFKSNFWKRNTCNIIKRYSSLYVHTSYPFHMS